MAQKPFFNFDKKDIPEMPIQNWILAMIRDKGKRRPRDALSIMYGVFIFTKELLPSIEPEFEYKCTSCGPYSEKVALAMKQLLSTNMLGMKGNGSSVLGGNSYILTEIGAKEAEKIVHKLPDVLKDKMEFMHFITTQMGLTGMVQFIYSIYPEHVYLHERREDIV
ncbi:MAG: hypothetical protein V3U20_10035 [Thermoplasmata archaeon]